MDDTPTQTLKNSNRSIAIIFIAIAIIVWLVIYSTYTPATPKITLEDKLTQLKDLRADKAQKQKEIYLIDQKIVPLKCSIFSEVGAKEQWNLECQDFYQEQQAKIQSTPAEPEQNDELDI